MLHNPHPVHPLCSAGVKEYRDLSKQLRELDKEQQSLGETLKSAAFKR